MAKAAIRAVGFGGWVLALLVGGSAAAAETPQKPQVDAFVAHSGLPRTWVVAIKPEIVVAIRDRDAVRPGDGPQKVRLQGEAVDEAMAEQLGYHSMRSTVEINCDTRRDRVSEIEVFAQHGLKGAGQRRPVPGGWIQPSEDAYLADVIRAVCHPSRPAPDAAPARLAEAPQLRPTLSAAPKASSRPAPPPGPGPARPGSEPSPPRLMTLVAAMPAAAPPPPPTGGRAQAQVGALNSEIEARRVLDRLAPALSAGLSTRVEVATVGGRTWYRALVAGFAGPAQAQAFCAEQRRRDAPCLVR